MPATATLAMVSIDCPDTKTVKAMSDFYQALLGWEVAYEGDGYAMLKDGAAAALGFGVAEGFTAPQWPNHGTKQFHLDLGADDVDAMVRRCVDLGATKPDDQPGADRWTVLLDPAGHPFCVTNLANWG